MTPPPAAPGDGTGAPFGLYLHVPFCARRCDYCAFAAWDDRTDLMGRYLAGLRRQLEDHRADLPPVTSVFVGGGTPSLAPPSVLAEVLGAVPLAPGGEVTVECNPETVSPGSLETYRAAGVTRISFGVQSMVPHVLRGLGRVHDPATVVAAVAAVRSLGFASFNLDLIYGGAGETLDDWRRTLEEALDLDPPHLSAYALTVEEGTPLAADAGRHPDDDDQADKYLVLAEAAEARGLAWYEISNFARSGHECRHNVLTWASGDYLGVGCAAHSHRDGRRWWNLRTPERWLEAVEAGRSVVAASEQLDPEARALESLQLALRTRRGVPRAALAAEAVDALGGLLRAEGDRWVLTVAGRLLANEVALRLQVPAGSVNT